MKPYRCRKHGRSACFKVKKITVIFSTVRVSHIWVVLFETCFLDKRRADML